MLFFFLTPLLKLLREIGALRSILEVMQADSAWKLNEDFKKKNIKISLSLDPPPIKNS